MPLLRSLIVVADWITDGDVNEDDKKAVGLDWQNNKFARASRFFVHFLVVTARQRCENA